MPEDKVSDPITDQEIAFAHLVLSGAMTDRQAAEAVGLNPDSAASTKAMPRVHAYMLGHRSAAQQQRVQQEADLSRLPRRAVERAVEGQHRPNPDRQQVLDRLWEIANLSPEMTRASVTGQVKALSIIVAMENFIPNRHAATVEKTSAPAPTPEIYVSEWRRKQQATTPAATNNDPQPNPTPPVPPVSPAPASRGACRGDQQQDSPGVPACPGVPRKPATASGSVEEAPPVPSPSQPTFAHRVPLADGQPPYVPDTRVPFSIKRNPFYPRHR
jgi:hypothetical protein